MPIESVEHNSYTIKHFVFLDYYFPPPLIIKVRTSKTKNDIVGTVRVSVVFQLRFFETRYN